MPKISEMQRPSLPLSGLELLPGLQGGGVDANVGVPLMAYGGLPTGTVLALRAPMAADMAATSDADPGAGNVRWNNANPALASVLYVSDADADAGSLAGVWPALTVGGFVYVQASDTSERRDNWQKWQVTSVTDASGYAKIGVSLQDSNGTLVDDEPVEFSAQQPTPSPGIDRNLVTAAVPASGVVPVDCSLGDYFTLAPTANITGWSITNVPPACSILVRFTQDSTPRTVAWPSSFRWAGGAGVVSTAAGAIDMLALTTFDGGATWFATLAKGFAP